MIPNYLSVAMGIHSFKRSNWFGIFGLEVENMVRITFTKLLLQEFWGGPLFLGAYVPRNCFGHVVLRHFLRLVWDFKSTIFKWIP